MLTKWTVLHRYFQQYKHYKEMLELGILDYQEDFTKVGDQIWANMLREYCQYLNTQQYNILVEICTDRISACNSVIIHMDHYPMLTDIKQAAITRKNHIEKQWADLSDEYRTVNKLTV